MDELYVDHQAGDKVRLRSGDNKGQRGKILALVSGMLDIQLENGTKTQIAPQEVTNFSLAARKAWQTMREQKDAFFKIKSALSDSSK
jgi:ribosomal protein L24